MVAFEAHEKNDPSRQHMSPRYLSLLAGVLTLSLFSIGVVQGGTIPAGTAITVKTMGSIYTKDIVGKQFTAELANDLAIRGDVIAPAGTKFIGKIVTSTKFGNSPLSVDLTAVKGSGGKMIPVKTTGPYEPQSAQRGRKRQVTTRDFVLPAGAKMQFHLAEAVTI